MRRRESRQTIALAPLTLRADLDSIDAEARTAEVVFSTGAPVERASWFSGERWIETLGLEAKNVRLKRLNNGAPFLNTHSAWNLSDVIGVVEPGSVELTAKRAKATVRFSKREDVEPIWRDVQDGILRNVSVGYRVHKYEVTKEEGKPEIRHAVDWEPYEISAVPIGADDGAKVRSDGEQVATNPCVIITRSMEKERGAMEPKGTETQLRQVDANADGSCPAGYEHGADGRCHLIEAAAGTEPNDRDAGAEAERKRVQGIIRACRAARLPQSFADKLIADGTELVKAQELVFETMAKNGLPDKGPGQGPSRVAIVGDDPLENVWRGIGGALLHRIQPEWFPMDENAKQYRMHSLLRAAEECLEQRGIRTRALSKGDIATLAFGGEVRLATRGGLHGIGDFANILADVANKSLRRAYDEAPQTFLPISRRIEASDFKPIKRNQLGEAPQLAKVLPSGEYQRGTIAEGKEQFALATYGKIFGINRAALINDDLDAFGRLTTMFGVSARNLESDLVWAEILRNANMGDGIALFHASHNNLAGAGGAIDVTTLGAGRAAMRNQKGLDGKTYLNISARYLIVPPAKETLGDQFTTVITPQQGGNVNPFAGRLTVLSEPRLEGGVTLDQHVPEVIAGSGVSWYLAASPDQAIDIIEYAFLSGDMGPTVESRVGFEVDGLEIKCRHDFAAKVIDFRGLYKNPGA